MKNNLQEFGEGLFWMVKDGDQLSIGVTQSAIDQVGTVAAVEIADNGDEFEEGDWIGEIRGKEQTIELTAPCKLRVSERNDELLEAPSVLEDDPTGDAWMLRVERLDE